MTNAQLQPLYDILKEAFDSGINYERGLPDGPTAARSLFPLAARMEEELAKLSNWHPIATAPKDGTPILLWWVPPHGQPTTILARWICTTHRYKAARHHCPNEPDCQMGWDSYAETMTHWMPLPSSPERET